MPESRARKSQIRWLAWAAAVAVVALGGAVLAAPALLDSAWLQGRLSAQEGLTVRWEDSRPGWGSLAVSALAIERDDPTLPLALEVEDRKSTRLNSSHVRISYAVFCLKKKKKTTL